MDVTHKQLADRLEVSVMAVAVIREILRGASAQSQRALAETEDDHLVAAAIWLAKFRGCHTVAEGITKELVKEVMRDEQNG